MISHNADVVATCLRIIQCIDLDDYVLLAKILDQERPVPAIFKHVDPLVRMTVLSYAIKMKRTKMALKMIAHGADVAPNETMWLLVIL